jgi:hypothetical protein
MRDVGWRLGVEKVFKWMRASLHVEAAASARSVCHMHHPSKQQAGTIASCCCHHFFVEKLPEWVVHAKVVDLPTSTNRSAHHKYNLIVQPPSPNSTRGLQACKSLISVSCLKNISILCIMLPLLKNFLPHPILNPERSQMENKKTPANLPQGPHLTRCNGIPA